MSYSVPSSVLFNTYKCPHNHSCLNTKNGKCPGGCEVVEAIGDTVLTLKSTEVKPSCPYRTSVLDLQLCGCPTRIALYQQLQHENP